MQICIFPQSNIQHTPRNANVMSPLEEPIHKTQNYQINIDQEHIKQLGLIQEQCISLKFILLQYWSLTC
uniref:Uncharacterized protein n=1 Tax=Arundo donax TaxID=35708 RepID=A0A0A9BL26_ARUDO